MQHHYTQQVDFAQLKSELQLMEKESEPAICIASMKQKVENYGA